MNHDKKQPGLPVVDVDQAFPVLTTEGASRSPASGAAGDQGPTVEAAIRDVLGWRPRVQDPKAFQAALAASFQLSTVEDHVVATYVPRGVAVQADLGGVTGGQASLYLRAKAAHEQITRMLDSLTPLRTDADPEDCEAYRGLVRDSVRRIVGELGREGGPRVPLVDSAFSTLTGFSVTAPPATPVVLGARAQGGRTPVAPATASIDPDSVPGQLGALRDRFGLDDDHVNTIDEEKQRTSFWTLVELITDLQGSWASRRLQFTLGAGNGFLGTDLVQVSRLLAAAAEQVDEFEALLDSVLVSSAERQTVVLDRTTGLTLDDLIQWMRVFFTEDGPNVIRDTGRDGLVSTFTPTVRDLLLTLREKLVRLLVPCCGPSCGGGCQCGSRGKVSCIPLGCCTALPPGMYASRVKIAVSTLCGLVERLTSRVIRIGRFAGAVLLDLTVTPFGVGALARVEIRGLHLRPTYIPAFVTGPDTDDIESLVLPLQGSASADPDTLSGIFDLSVLSPLRTLLSPPGAATRDPIGIVLAASEVPIAIVDGELGRVVQGPAVTTWPRLRRADALDLGTDPDDEPEDWGDIPANQRFVPQAPPDPVDPVLDEDDCVEICDDVEFVENPADEDGGRVTERPEEIPGDRSRREPARREYGRREPAPREYGRREPAPREYGRREPGGWEFGPREPAGRERAGRELEPREPAGRQFGGQEFEPRDAAGPEGAVREPSVGRETTGPETAGPETTGPQAAGTEVTGPETTAARAAGTETPGARAAGTEATGVEATGRKATGPATTGVRATEPEGTGAGADSAAPATQANGGEAAGREAAEAVERAEARAQELDDELERVRAKAQRRDRLLSELRVEYEASGLEPEQFARRVAAQRMIVRVLEDDQDKER